MDFNIPIQPLASLQAKDSSESLVLVKKALEGKGVENPARDIVALNAGAAIYVCGIADTLKQGVEMAEDMIGSGLAKVKLSELASFTRYYKNAE